MLEIEGDIEVVGEAKNGRQAVELTRKLRPAVVVMDITMPLLKGLDATRIILNTFPRTKVIILSVHGDDAYVEEATALGAVGYLLKQSSSTLLPNAVRDVQKGGMYFCPSIAKGLRQRMLKHNHKKQQGVGQAKSRLNSRTSPLQSANRAKGGSLHPAL